jgi:hypothetical protein
VLLALPGGLLSGEPYPSTDHPREENHAINYNSVLPEPVGQHLNPNLVSGCKPLAFDDRQ